MKQSRGFTLIELLVAIGMVSLLVLLAVPRVRTTLIKSDVRGARGAVATMFQQAKIRAVQEARRTTVNFSDSTSAIWITAKPRRSAGAAPCNCDTVGAVQNLQTQYGVTIDATADAFAFDPRGLGALRTGSDMTVYVVRSGFKDSVMISGFGELTK